MPRLPAIGQAIEVRTPVTILVSIDAFSPDYLRHGNTPNLDALAAEGVQGTMRPSFPALTFPNHEAMITGLRPDRSGIVAGVMYDPRRPDAKFTNQRCKPGVRSVLVGRRRADLDRRRKGAHPDRGDVLAGSRGGA